MDDSLYPEKPRITWVPTLLAGLILFATGFGLIFWMRQDAADTPTGQPSSGLPSLPVADRSPRSNTPSIRQPVVTITPSGSSTPTPSSSVTENDGMMKVTNNEEVVELVDETIEITEISPPGAEAAAYGTTSCARAGAAWAEAGVINGRATARAVIGTDQHC